MYFCVVFTLITRFRVDQDPCPDSVFSCRHCGDSATRIKERKPLEQHILRRIHVAVLTISAMDAVIPTIMSRQRLVR